MFDWRTAEETPFPELPEESERRQPRRRRVLIGLGLLLILAIAVGLVLRWRINERREAIRADLAEFVRYEEQQRRFGIVESGESIYVNNAPTEWKRAFLDTFASTGETDPTPITIAEVEFDGITGLVVVEAGRHQQLRAYRLTDVGWQRAPLPRTVWGGTRTARVAGITVQFRKRDSDFVETLLHDLPTLLEQWPADEAVRRIVVEPDEFAPALRQREPDTIVLNSPLTVSPEAPIAGTGAIRFALADELLMPAVTEQENAFLLPNAARFGFAARTVAAARWAFDQDAHARLRSTWREMQPEERASPFLGDWPGESRPVSHRTVWTPTPAEAVALLAADHIYSQAGATVLAQIVTELPDAESWDTLFQTHLGRYTVEVEAEVSGTPAEATVDRTVPASLRLPLTVNVSIDDAAGETFTAAVEGSAARLEVDARNATVTGPDGETLPTGCTGLYRDITIDAGDWLVPGKYLMAHRATVHTLEPSIALDSFVAPPDSLAYLLLGRQRDDQQRARRLAAVQEDGTVSTLATLPAAVRLVAGTPGHASPAGQIVLRFNMPYCNQTWLFRYDPAVGITDRWLTARDWRAGHTVILWHPRQDRGLLVGVGVQNTVGLSVAFDGDWQYGPLPPADSNIVTPTGTLNGSWWPLGWLAATNQIAAFDQTIPQEAAVRLIDLETENVMSTIIYRSKQPTPMVLSHDHTHMFYRSLNLTGSTVIRGVDLITEANTVLLRSEEGEHLWPVQGVQLPGHLLVHSVPAERSYGKELKVIDLSAPGQGVVVDAIADDEDIERATACSDGRVVYTVAHRDTTQTDLRLWHPDGTVKTLTTNEAGGVLPITCRG